MKSTIFILIVFFLTPDAFSDCKRSKPTDSPKKAQINLDEKLKDVVLTAKKDGQLDEIIKIIENPNLL